MLQMKFASWEWVSGLMRLAALTNPAARSGADRERQAILDLLPRAQRARARDDDIVVRPCFASGKPRQGGSRLFPLAGEKLCRRATSWRADRN